MPAPGQGALAIQCRRDDLAIKSLLTPIHDQAAAATVTAERLLLQKLGGGCSAPIGASAKLQNGLIVLRARVVSVDGRHVYNAEARGKDASEVAHQAALQLMASGAAKALVVQGGAAASAQTVLRHDLSGKTVVVTRPQNDDESDALAAQFTELGAECIHLPTFSLVPIADAATITRFHEKLGEYDWVIFTSSAAVRFFLQDRIPVQIADSNANTKIAAVGPATQAALNGYGVEADAVPPVYRGEEIVKVLGQVSGKHILLPRSQKGSRELPEALRRAGAEVEDMPLYSPASIVLHEDAKHRLLRGVDAVAFASGSAVEGFAESLQGDRRFDRFWDNTVAVCIGPATEAAARYADIPVHVVAAEHTFAGMARSLADYFSSQDSKG